MCHSESQKMLDDMRKMNEETRALIQKAREENPQIERFETIKVSLIVIATVIITILTS